MTNQTPQELIASVNEFIFNQMNELRSIREAIVIQMEVLERFKAEINNEPEDNF